LLTLTGIFIFRRANLRRFTGFVGTVVKMPAGTPAGDAFTFAELKEMFENAGFSRNEHIPLAPLPQHLIVSMK